MNRWILIFTVFATAFASCKAQKNALLHSNDTTSNAVIDSSARQNVLIQQINAGGAKVLSDSGLHQLQLKSDLLIISAVENFAWARSITYSIIARQNDVWKGYIGKSDLKTIKAHSQFMETSAKNIQCDSLLSFLTQNKAWEIKGDFGKRFCDSSNAKCGAINDETTSRIYIVTKNSFINPSYYAPEFYEQCCPDEKRALFLHIMQSVKKAVGKGPEQ